MNNQNQNIFIVKGISIKEKNEKDWAQELYSLQMQHNKKYSMDYIKRFDKSFYHKAYSYIVDEYNHAYFLDFDTAEKSVFNDMGGMNSSGAYDYAAIFEIPTEVSYAEHISTLSYSFYKYNHNIKQYQKLNDNKMLNVLKDFFHVNLINEIDR